MSTKKSYMDTSNVLNEKHTLGSVLKYLKSKLPQLSKTQKNSKAKTALKDLNNSVTQLEKTIYKISGRKITLPKYDVDDFKKDTKQD